MTPRTLHLDWRGVPDLSRSADFYSIASTHEKRPVTGNPNGKVLVAMSSTILYGPEGTPAARPFNLALYNAAKARGALTERTVWSNEFGWSTRLFDLTKRFMASDVLSLIRSFFPDMDGIHWDYASAWSWQFKDMEPTDAAWDNTYRGLFESIRAMGKLALCQQWQYTDATSSASGRFLEQSYTSFGMTPEKHAAQIKTIRELAQRVDGRETLFVSELREPAKYPKEYVDGLKAWAVANDVALSFGRDALAGVGLP